MYKFLAGVVSVLIVIVIGNVVIVAQERPDMPIDKAVRDEVIQSLSANLTKSYVFPEVAKQIAAKLQSTDYSSIVSGSAFADALTKDIQSVNDDKHLRVRFSAEKLPVRAAVSEPTAEEVAEAKAFNQRVNYGFDSVKRLDGNIGYIELRGFFDPKEGEETVAAAMNFVANTDALIFDLRRNGGGDPAMVALICSYFFGDKKVHLNDLYWREGDKTTEFWTQTKVKGHKYLNKDIYILTSSRTFSGAEEFSYNLRNLERATIVGETTGGGAHPGGSFRLQDHFSAFIATGRAISPITKTNWEGTGVKPHVETNKDIALETAYKAAVEKLVLKTADARLKASLDGLIKKLEKEIEAYNAKY